MKAKGAPKKLYLLPNGLISYCRNTDEDIEYTITDAFIEKACAWLENNLQGIVGGSIYIEDFIKYMKGE